jgi:small GTP-binding protein
MEGHLLKILVVGDVGCGKTSLIKRYVHGVFSMHYKATIGVDFALKVVTVDESLVRLQLWDIAGQERFGNMTSVYYREAAGACVVYDVTRPGTLDTALKWRDDIETKLGKPIPTLLLANKCDLANGSAVGDTPKGFTACFPTSAKNGTNVEEAMRALVRDILKRDADDVKEKEPTVDLAATPPPPADGCSC